MTEEQFTAPCHTCALSDTCDPLMIYQVIVYNCSCLKYKQEVKEEGEQDV